MHLQHPFGSDMRRNQNFQKGGSHLTHTEGTHQIAAPEWPCTGLVCGYKKAFNKESLRGPIFIMEHPDGPPWKLRLWSFKLYLFEHFGTYRHAPLGRSLWSGKSIGKLYSSFCRMLNTHDANTFSHLMTSEVPERPTFSHGRLRTAWNLMG